MISCNNDQLLTCNFFGKFLNWFEAHTWLYFRQTTWTIEERSTMSTWTAAHKAALVDLTIETQLISRHRQRHQTIETQLIYVTDRKRHQTIETQLINAILPAVQGYGTNANHGSPDDHRHV